MSGRAQSCGSENVSVGVEVLLERFHICAGPEFEVARESGVGLLRCGRVSRKNSLYVGNSRRVNTKRGENSYY